MKILEIAMALAAAYSAAAYLFWFAYSVKNRVSLERETFHLGLCFILAAGFLGLMLK